MLRRLRRAALDADPEALVEDMITLNEQLRGRDVSSIVITTSDGRLVGTFTLAEAEPKPESEDTTECCLCE